MSAVASALAQAPVLEFLRCRTPAAWVEAAVGNLDVVLQDHATLELKAAQQAQKLMRRYGGAGPAAGSPGIPAEAPGAKFRSSLLHRMSRLAREELRHFEQVLALLDERGSGYCPVSASRYAAGLHAHVAGEEPGRLVDTLLVGAIIEARSCERFASLVPALEQRDSALAKFYSSLLRSEARHYQDYLALARHAAEATGVARAVLTRRLDALLDADEALVTSVDERLRFHSGVPPGGTRRTGGSGLFSPNR